MYLPSGCWRRKLSPAIWPRCRIYQSFLSAFVASRRKRRARVVASGGRENREAADPHLSSPLQGEEEPSRSRGDAIIGRPRLSYLPLKGGGSGRGSRAGSGNKRSVR